MTRRRRDRGQALVEFALVLPVITLIVFGFIDVGRFVFSYTTLTNAARQAARVAAVNQVDPVNGPFECRSNTPVTDVNDPHWTFRGCAMTAGATIGIAAGDVTVSYTAPPGSSTSCSPTVNVGCIATVTVVHSFDPITPMAGSILGSVSMTTTSQMPVERLFP
jgi:Flp pilus assembly protein TadG